MKARLAPEFFQRDVLKVAPDLLGKTVVRKSDNQFVQKYLITETEAYRGIEDLACHASKGRTKRTEVMFQQGGLVYVYLIYGMYWLLNIVTGKKNDASAVLIRSVKSISGPGRVGKALNLDQSFYGENIYTSSRIWVEDTETKGKVISSPRIGIDYAGEPWKSKPWRFQLINGLSR